MKLLAMLLLIAASSCSTEPHRQFNSDDLQDYSCYGKLGGMYGYCDMRVIR